MEIVIGTVGRRERKKLETRTALRRAALTLVAEKGLDGVTVAEIADAADVSERTFFNHFPCKEDAVVGVDGDRVQMLRNRLAAYTDESDPLTVLRLVLTDIGAALADHRDELLQERAIVADNPTLRAREMSGFAQYERELVADVARRSHTVADRDVYPMLAARAAVAAFRTAVALWCAPGNARSFTDLINEAFDRLAKGLPPPLP